MDPLDAGLAQLSHWSSLVKLSIYPLLEEDSGVVLKSKPRDHPRGGSAETNGVSTPNGPRSAAPPGEPRGPSRPGKVSLKKAALSARCWCWSIGRSVS